MEDNNFMYPPMDADDLCSFLNLPMENFGNLNDILRASQPEPQPLVEPADPTHWDLFPTMGKVQTDYAFQMHIDPGKNRNWLCDKVTGKVFIKMNQVMTVNMSYKRPAYNRENLFLRGMIVFDNMDDIQRPVKRCANHRIVNEYQEMPFAHIVRCCHPNTKYVGDENAEVFGKRLSFVIPLSPFANKDGIARETIKLEFLCQNSCLTGINRKTTSVVFTLEDERHEIIGKHIMPFKVCSCPRRDMTREDTGLPMKRESSITTQDKIPVKKICQREMVVQSPQPSTSAEVLKPITQMFKMPTKKLLRHVLRCANNEIHGLMALEKSPENVEKLKKYARHVKHLLDAHTDD